MNLLHQVIKKDFQVRKFGYYGLLKNLRFFEPYLYVYLLSQDINLFEIGLLIAIREIITYVFEIPSGIFADYYGKKTELVICFLFYIASFVFFFIGSSFFILSIAMILYGFGDALRSGTHKAMIYSYLEQKDWFTEKTFVYGRTRSFSLIGSSVSAFFSIVLVLYFKDLSWFFLLTIVPYILNFLLILSYPGNLNEKRESSKSLKQFFKLSYDQLKSIIKTPKLFSVLTSSSLFDAVFKTTKDYIQPIIVLAITGLGFSILQFEEDVNKKMVLGFVYGLFYILSAGASRNVYLLQKLANSRKLMNLLFDALALLLVFVFVALKLENLFLIIFIYLLIYLVKNARRPLLVDVAGDIMNKEERATVLSIDSQMKSFFVIILAPAFGFMATRYSIENAFLAIAVLIFVVNLFLKKRIK